MSKELLEEAKEIFYGDHYASKTTGIEIIDACFAKYFGNIPSPDTLM